MPQLLKQKAVYKDLFSLPENMTGEIIEGELVAAPRPSRRHAVAASAYRSTVTILNQRLEYGA